MELKRNYVDQPTYRSQALDYHLRAADGVGILRVSPPWSWVVMLALGAVVTVGLLLAILGKVEVTERGPGVLRPLAGIRHIQAQTAGTVAEVRVRAGNPVEAQEVCIQLDAPSLKTSVFEAEGQVRLYGAEYLDLGRQQEALHKRQQATIEARIVQLEQDEAGHKRSVGRSTQRRSAIQKLADQGIVGALELADAQEQLEQADRQLRSASQALRQARQERVEADAVYRKETWGRNSERERALSRRMALDFNLEQQSITSPLAGFVDSLMVRRGDSVQPGQVVARIVPRDAELRVFAFVAEKHRAWIKEGDLVKLELSQFPYPEFGTLVGRVVAMGVDFASLDEIKAALGEAASLAGPTFKVEVEVVGNQRGPLAKVTLRPGMRVDTRFILRRQSPITFAFEPLNRWLR